VQYALLGKLPVSLVTPITLHSILSDIALNLPENYECPSEDSRAAFFTVQNYRLPYAVVARLLLKVSEYHYFGLAVDQRDFTLLTEADLQRRTTSSVTICPAEVPLYHAQLLTCEGSLFFQNANSYQLCRKNVLRHYQTPTLLHHGSKWAYHFPDPRQVNIRCPQDHGWSSRTVSLVGSGLIHNESACHIASQELRTLPVLSKTAELPRHPTAVSARQSSGSREP